MIICSMCGSDKVNKNGVRHGKQRYKCTKCNTESQPITTEDYKDIAHEGVRLAKKAQKLQDKNRIENKTFRELARVENAVVEYVAELRRVVEKNTIEFNGIELPNYPKYPAGAVGIIHLSDMHFNELVDIIGNRYDFNVASKRLVLFAEKILTQIGDNRGLSLVYIVFTGDMLNSDRRIDELLSMATNRAQATFLASKLLSQFILHIASMCGVPVKVISVTGNESRIREDYTQLDSMATDNFDYMIYELMKIYLSRYTNIEFVSGNTFEYILEIHGKSILIVHGHRLGKMTHTDLSKAIAKWAKRGVLITVIMCGHLHETNITDTLLRNGSLVGNNAYSDVGLNLHSHASQNFYIVNADGTIDATKFDLQYVDDYSAGYDIDEELASYNAKSIDKIKNKRTIMEIII